MKKIRRWFRSVICGATLTCIFLTIYQRHRQTILVHPIPRYSVAQKCSSEHPRLLIIVSSAVENFVQRRAVRETWGSWKYINGSIVLNFILGLGTNDTHNRLVLEEQEIYKDLLLNDILDTYENLTYKSLAMLKSVSENCSNVAYVLKADDDVFINVPNLLKESERLRLKKNVIFGYKIGPRHPVIRYPSKWFVPKSMYPGSWYPSFVSGSAYVMSGDVPAKLYAANSNAKFLYLEDVYITGILAEKANVTRLGARGFWHLKRNSTLCTFRDVVSGHYVNVTEMRNIWFELSNNCRV